MKIQIEITRPRWLRLPRTWKTRTLTVAVAVVVVGVPVAWASHQFADVPNTNAHHDDISAIFGARITAGCNPPTNNLYCPDQFVRRDQMGSFLRRGLGRASMGGSATYADNLPEWPTYADLAVRTITTGGTPGGTGFVLVTASAVGYQTAGSSSVPSRLNIRIVRDAGGASDDVYETLTPTTVGQANPNVSAATTWVFQVPTGTVETFRLKAARDWGPGPVNARGRISVLYVPFGNTGAATLGASEVAGDADSANRP